MPTLRLLTLALAAPALAQNFEHDLRPPAHETWNEAGTAVDIDGDWAVVSGVARSASASPPGADLPALFHRDGATGEWVFERSLAPPDIAGFPFTTEHAAIDVPHALLGMGRSTVPGRVVQPWRLDPMSGTWAPGADLISPVPAPDRFGEVLDVDGDTALVSDFGLGGRGVVHRYAFDAIARQWMFAETWSAPAGAGSYGFALDLDGDTAVVFDLDASTAAPSRVHVHERGPAGWSLTQTITGGQGTATPGWLYGNPLALDGDLLVLANGPTLEVFRRPAPGQQFTLDAVVDLGAGNVATALDVEDETIVAGQRYSGTPGGWSTDGLVEVYREAPCLGPGWQRTHELHTAYRHNANVYLGDAVALSGGRVVAGMPGFRFLNGPFHGWNPGAASVFDVARDCDGNGVLDACDILAGAADVDGDGVLDDCEAVGRRYCSPGNTTTLGAPAYVLLQGSDRAQDDRIFFTFVGVPTGAPGLMLASRGAGFTANPAGSRGDLCLDQPIGRFAGRTHSFWFAGGDGIISQRYPLTSPLPGGGPMFPGETWFFQGWFREAGSSNFTDGIQLMLR